MELAGNRSSLCVRFGQSGGFTPALGTPDPAVGFIPSRAWKWHPHLPLRASLQSGISNGAQESDASGGGLLLHRRAIGGYVGWCWHPGRNKMKSKSK